MSTSFQSIGLMTRYRSPEIIETLQTLEKFLLSKKIDIVLEQETAKFLTEQGLPVASTKQFGLDCDLIIAVGGDGSFLSASHCALKYDVPVLGVNRGRLGFLADIQPHQLIEKVENVLHGEYTQENRFLLTTEVESNEGWQTLEPALNDIVLKQGQTLHMLEFDIYIDDEFVCQEHSDGLIVSTPTGSTAYALSGGGPILHPNINAIITLPMFSHTLSSRPLVVSGDSVITVMVTNENTNSPTICCDGIGESIVDPGFRFRIKKHDRAVHLIHPQGYQYYQSLRGKLGWGNKLIDKNHSS